MPNLNDFSAITTLSTTDELHTNDVSDTTDNAAGSDKKITYGNVQTQIKAHLQVANVAALATLTEPANGDVVEVKGYAATEGVGGGLFWLDTSGSLGASAENAVTYFAADASYPANSYWRRKLDNVLVLTAHMAGAVGDDSTDNITEVQALFDTAAALNTPSVVRPTVVFPHDIAYRISTPATCEEDINIIMESPLKYTGSESTSPLTVGTTAVQNNNVTLDLRIERLTVSDWTSEGSIGVKLFNCRTCRIDLASIVGFTIGAQCMARGLKFADNIITIGDISNCKYALDLTNETDGVAGACQDNLIQGGNVSVDSGTRATIARYGVRIVSLDVSPSINVRNKFFDVSFELEFATSTPADAIPMAIEDGNQNQTISCLHKGNSPDFAVCSNASTGNILGHTGTLGTVDEQDTAVENLLRFVGDERDNGPFRQIFDSGPMHKTACLYSASQTHIPQVHVTTSSIGTNGIAQTSITTFVAETFTADAGTYELIDVAHSRINGDVVYLTHSVPATPDLPNGLEVETRYYVVGKTTDRFKLSATLGGGPITITDTGTGTHTYNSPHRYVEMDSTRALGVTVDTQVAKQFSVVTDFETGFGGLLRVRAIDADGNILTDNPSPAHVIGSGTTMDWVAGTYGGHYAASADITGEVFFRVGTSVKSIDVLVGGGSSVIRIRRLSIFTIDTEVLPTPTIIYDEGPVGTNWGTLAPTSGVWEAGRVIVNVSQSATGVRQWHNKTAGSPGDWDIQAGPTTITPQMYGFVDDFDGSTGTDNSTAVQAAADACDALNATLTVRPTLYFPQSAGYYCNSTITVKELIHVRMDAPIIHDNTESSIGLVIGTTAIRNTQVKLKLRVARLTGDTSDWTNEGSIGAKVINLQASDLYVDVGENNGGFTIGVQCMGSGHGFSWNTVRLGVIRNNKIGVDVTNETSGSAGFCNESLFIGGSIICDSGLRSGIERHGIRLISADETTDAINANKFDKTAIECRTECLPVLITHGQKNKFVDMRDETNGTVFAKVLHGDSRKNTGNTFDLAFGAGTLTQQGNAHNNIISYRAKAAAYSPSRLVFDSGDMPANAMAYDSTQTFVRGVQIGSSTGATGLMKANSVPWYVSETFTTIFASDDDKLLDTAHTLRNGDRVYLTHSVPATPDLPNGLAVETLYYVVERTTNDFKLSVTKNGAATTFSDDGSGTHTYNARSRFVEFSTARSVGTRVDTKVAKNYVLERDTDIDEEAVDYAGRALIICYDADDVVLQNEEEFTVDDGNNELLQANHTVVVGDRLTFTTDGTLPVDLQGGGDFYVISLDDTATGRFRVSATEGGSTVTDLSGDSGTHTYHLSYQYATSDSLSWLNSFGGAYRQGTDTAVDFAFKIRDEVKSITVSLTGGTNVCRAKRIKLHTTDIEAAPRTWLDYDAQPHLLASESPTVGVYFTPLMTVNDSSSTGTPTEWVLDTDGSPGTWRAIPEELDTETVTTGSPALAIHGSTLLDSSGGAITATLGSGIYMGQPKSIRMTDATTSSTVSITLHETFDPEVATFDAVGEYLLLAWSGTEWATLKATCTFL